MNRITELKEQIGSIRKEIELIQDECNHPKASLDIKHKADTGNYDPTQDSYWTEYRCGLCEKSWNEDQ